MAYHSSPLQELKLSIKGMASSAIARVAHRPGTSARSGLIHSVSRVFNSSASSKVTHTPLDGDATNLKSGLTLSTILVALLLAYATSKILAFLALQRQVAGQPGFFSILKPTTDWAHLVGLTHRWRWLNFQECDAFKSRFTHFQEFKSTAYGITSFFPPKYTAYVADPAGLAYIFSPASDNVLCERSIAQERSLLTFWADNVFTLQGADWKRHRMNGARAFTNRNVQLVWESTQRALQGLFGDLAKTADENGTIHVDDICGTTIELTLDVLSESAFGRPVTWASHASDHPAVIPEGHKLDFRTALDRSLHGLFVKGLLPDWALRLVPSWRKIRDSFEELEGYLKGMVAERRELREQGIEQHDLLSCLLDGSDSERPERQLTEAEVLANMFVFMFAGHETSAQAISYALNLLAMFPDVQEDIYREVVDALPDSLDTVSSSDLLHKLPLCKGACYEAMRLFPPAVQTRRTVIADMSIPYSSVPSSPGEPVTTSNLFVPAGSHINLSITGLQCNPDIYPDPMKFDPTRFRPDGTPDKLLFIPFGGASRGCIGQRFATIQVISVIAHVVRHYKISLPPARMAEFELLPGESWAKRYERYFQPSVFITLQHQKRDLYFTKRE